MPTGVALTGDPARGRFDSRSASLAGLVLIAAAVAWIATLTLARHMGAMPGTMGFGLAPFIGAWTLMMAAMMLPSVTPLASMYARSIRDGERRRLTGFGAGYLLVWAASGVPVFVLAALGARLAERHPDAATGMAVAIFAGCGLYQLSQFKEYCLARCRAPFGQLLRYASWRGRFADLRVGIHHGAFCLGCCWALMVLMVAFGVMNVAAMVLVAAVVVIEKVFARGALFSRATGFASLALAAAVIWVPSLAPGLYQPVSLLSHGAGM